MMGTSIRLSTELRTVILTTDEDKAVDVLRTICDAMVGLSYRQITIDDALIQLAGEVSYE